MKRRLTLVIGLLVVILMIGLFYWTVPDYEETLMTLYQSMNYEEKAWRASEGNVN